MARKRSGYDEDGARPMNGRAIGLLGRIRTAAAKFILFDVLQNGPEPLGKYVPSALAQINDREVRKRIQTMMMESEPSSLLFERLCKVAEETRHGDFLPGLIDCLDRTSPQAAAPILQALAKIGGAAIGDPVIRWLTRHQDQEFEKLDAYAALTASGSEAAREYFQRLEASADEKIAAAGTWELIEGGFASTERIRELLLSEDRAWRLSVLDILADRADEGWRTPDRITATVKSLVDAPDTRYAAVNALARIEITGYRQERVAPNRRFFRELLASNQKNCGNEDDSDPRPIAAHVLGVIEDAGAYKRLLAYAVNQESGLSLRVSSIGALGNLHQSRDDLVRALLPLLDDPEGAIASAAADAIASVDFTALKDHRANRYVTDALARLSAERGILLFPTFYVDQHGITAFWKGQADSEGGTAFISMNQEDGAVLDRLLTHLLGRELQFNFDKLERTDFGIVCFGPKGISPHQSELIPLMLARQVDNHPWPLTIVLLPGATSSDLPPALLDLPIISYSPIDNAEESVARLIEQLRSQRRVGA